MATEKSPRAKRRKLSERKALDEGDYAISSPGDRDAHSSLLFSPTGNGGRSDHTSNTTPTRPSRRRSSRSKIDIEEEMSDRKDDIEGVNETESPSRVGLRSSGRQRKPPKRYWEETRPQPDQKPRSASSKRGRGPNNTRGKSSDSEIDEVDREPPNPLVHVRAKHRADYASTLSDAKDVWAGDVFYNDGEPALDEDQDGLDDFISMQLQPGHSQEGPGAGESAVFAAEPLPDYAKEFQSLAQEDLYEELGVMTKFILEKLNGRRLSPLKGLESEYQKIYHLMEQTVTAGEGNSMLVYGSRGCGKSAIIKTAISSLREEHGNDFHVVHLNGFLQTDDRLALREVWRQLGREMKTEDEAEKINSYADTMATLLALLSHPEELSGSSGNSTEIAAKSVIIILDEFDLFVSHARQTLLYNLFDIAQARKAPVAVIGLTTKVDITEMLEKRVKSRFSHRQVFIPLPMSLDTFSEACYSGLSVDESEVSALGSFAGMDEISIRESSSWHALLDGWRAYLKGLWNDERFQWHLQRIYHQTKSVAEFFVSSLLAVTELHLSTCDTTAESCELQVPTPSSFCNQRLSCPDPAPLPFDTSASASSLPLSLLLAAARLTALYDTDNEVTRPQSLVPIALSFSAVYAEYVRLLTSAKTSASISGATATAGRVWGREVAREAWEKLTTWGLVNPIGAGSGTVDGRIFRVEISFEEAVALAGTGGSLGKWWRNG